MMLVKYSLSDESDNRSLIVFQVKTKILFLLIIKNSSLFNFSSVCLINSRRLPKMKLMRVENDSRED